jgi:site-specific recombinase XerD
LRGIFNYIGSGKMMKANAGQILSIILKENAYTRKNGRVASQRTVTAYTEVLNMAFDQLNDLDFKIQNPRNLTETHIAALCRHWHKNRKQVSTIQEYLSKLRVFSGWIGKDGMVKSLPNYLPDVDKKKLKVSKVAQESKSWSENGVNIIQKIEKADALDWKFGLMIRMMLAFGLRRKEVTHIKPWKADLGDKLVIYLGEAKGGRPRDIYFDNHEQRVVLDYVKIKLKKNEHLGWETDTRGKPATLKYNIRRYNDYMARIGITKLGDGVTGHGLRAQYAENAALIAKMIPPTLGGTRSQMDRRDLDVKRAQISELLGHSRISVTASYYGSFGREVKTEEVSRCKNNIEAGLTMLTSVQLLLVSAERIPDCLQLVGELTALNIAITLQQVQHLWGSHSVRYAVPWVRPRDGNAEAIEVEALKLISRQKDDGTEISNTSY